MKRRELLRGLLALPVVGVGAVVLGVASKRPMAAMRGGRVGASEFHARGRYDYDAWAYPIHSPQNFSAWPDWVKEHADRLYRMECERVQRAWEEYSRCK